MKKKQWDLHKRKTFYTALGIMLVIIGLPIFIIAVNDNQTGDASFAYDQSVKGQLVTPTQTTIKTCVNNGIDGSVNVKGWKLVNCEDFNEINLPVGTLPSGWGAYNGGGSNTTVGVGRTPSQCAVGNGIVTLTQLSNGATCGMASNFSQKYGVWETRMRAFALGSSSSAANRALTLGSSPHPVLLLWPTTVAWPQGGEYDYAETDIGSPMQAFFHCATSSGGNCASATSKVDYSQWHNYAIKWTPTRVTGYIDGKEWITTTNVEALAPGPMHEAIQLDNLSGQTPVKLSQMQVDWVHVYTP